MATPEHEKLEQLFSTALEKDSWAERAAYLDETCADDADLRTQVETLLRVHGRVGSFLDAPPVDPNATLESWTPSEATGTKIGRSIHMLKTRGYNDRVLGRKRGLR